MKRFLDKVSLITGSSNGIGRATAILFANEGSKITITGRDAQASAETKAECIKAGAKESDILEILGDITKDDVREKLVKETVRKFGKLDILVNNHGGTVKERDEQGKLLVETFDTEMKLNCGSTVSMCLNAIPYLKESKGSIVNVSSVTSKMAALPLPFYAMAKASLDHLTRLLAMQHARDGIRVNCVNPGFVETAIFGKSGYTEEQQKKMIEMMEHIAIPCGKFGQPRDIAELIAFLADNRTSRYITGQSIIIDGGTSLIPAGMQSAEQYSFRPLGDGAAGQKK